MDISAWLRELGLERYEQAFQENEVDAEILPKLTADDLKEIGVAAVGHRRKLLEALAALAEPASRQQGEPSASAEAAPTARPAGAERRPLTVMFCDLADSTALSTELDPEDLQDLIRAYRERCTALIREYGGFVAKYMGDGILVYFGYPKALERNAERAVMTGLAIVEAVAELSQSLGSEKGIDIAVRIGIATGLVVVGEVVGEGLAQERTVIGEAPNVAARLQSIAPRNGIVIGGLTKEIVGDAFVYEDLGAHELKGISGLVNLWAVLRLAEETDEEGEAVAAKGLPLVGRDEEIGLLRRAWESTKEEGRGQVVLVMGEPGIGKSALVETLRARVREEGLARIALRCSPYHTGSALWPVIEHLRRLTRWQPEDGPETRLAKLETMLAGTGLAETGAVPLFASLLSLPLSEGRHPPLDLSPEQLKQQTQDALIAWTLEEAERRPLLEVWEDLHWADPSTLELLGLLVEQAPTVPLLIVLTFRPEFRPPWPSRSHMTPITLARLERPQIEVMVTRLAGGRTMPAEVVEHIVARTDGVPLYVEELTKAILDSDILRVEAGRYVLTGQLAAVSIPATLQESLMARLDRLPTVREVAQLGAVLGREFAYEMLRALGVISEPTLSDGLGRLVEAELLYQRGRPPKARYVFKHALVQDAAYQSLLKRTRQHYHRQVAELLETSFSEVVEAQPELLAHHFSEAGQADRAILYWERAGNHAVERSANHEAVTHLEKGLELIANLPEGLERDQREMGLRLTLGTALLANKGYAAPEVSEAYAQTRELCQRVGTPEQLFSATWGLWRNALFGGRLALARSLAHELLEVAVHQDQSILALQALHAAWTSLLSTGDFELCRQHSQQGRDLYDSADHRTHVRLYAGHDPGVCANSHLMLAHWFLGHLDQAVDYARDTIASAEELGHPLTLIFAHFFTSYFHLFRRDPAAAGQHAEACIALSREHGDLNYGSLAGAVHGWATAVKGDLEGGISEIGQGLATWRRTEAVMRVPEFLAVLAEAQGWAGRAEQGLEMITEALGLVEVTGEEKCLAEIHRIKGELLLGQSIKQLDDSEACFGLALEVARRQQAKVFELRAAVRLSRLQAGTGRRDQARDLLSPVYEWFTEGLDTPDLRDAKALLDELA